MEARERAAVLGVIALPPGLDPRNWIAGVRAGRQPATQEGRAAGRRHSTVIVAEGARDRHGEPISSEKVCRVLGEKLGLRLTARYIRLTLTKPHGESWFWSIHELSVLPPENG